MNVLNFPFDEISKLTFEPKPKPLPAILRPIYRISTLALILHTNCRNGHGSFLKIQFFNWLLKSTSKSKIVNNILSNDGILTLEFIHVDPMVNFALKYAYADGIISITGNHKYALTENGCKYVNVIQNETSLLRQEKDILSRIGQRITEVRLREEII